MARRHLLPVLAATVAFAGNACSAKPAPGVSADLVAPASRDAINSLLSTMDDALQLCPVKNRDAVLAWKAARINGGNPDFDKVLSTMGQCDYAPRLRADTLYKRAEATPLPSAVNNRLRNIGARHDKRPRGWPHMRSWISHIAAIPSGAIVRYASSGVR